MSLSLASLSLMNIWLVRLPFESDTLSEELFDRAIQCVDQESRSRIKRFYHREDRWRCVVGRLAPRVLLKELGAEPHSVTISSSETGKLYVRSPFPNVHFNISHDSSYVAMTYASDDTRNDADVGVDVMKAEIPPGESIASFASQLSDQLTLKERLHVALHLHDPPVATLILFKYWTIKEAYTKALGVGLGFDFTRVEYAPTENGADRVIVDGSTLRGWELKGFIWRNQGTQYVGMATQCTGGDDMASISWTQLNHSSSGSTPGWIRHVRVVDLVKQAQPLG